MPAGREMDKLIAINVMQWIVRKGPIPPFSTDIAAAWEALEHVRQNAKLDEYTVDYLRLEWYGGKWCCRIHFTPHDDEIVWAEDKSLPLAICKACLLAMGVIN